MDKVPNTTHHIDEKSHIQLINKKQSLEKKPPIAEKRIVETERGFKFEIINWREILNYYFPPSV
jgi:hypothetical protein